jgi:hypothetical protein
MSEYRVIDVEFRDEKVLIDALKEMGYNPTVTDESRPLQGYQGDDREQKAHIIIPRKQVGGSSNDVGFERIEKGFKLHASEFDRSWRTGEKIKTLKQTYSEKFITNKIRKNSKYSLRSRNKTKDGKIRIKIRRIY